MHCPFCRHTDSRVVDSRAADDGTAIRRRRQCPECGRRFTTVENAALDGGQAQRGRPSRSAATRSVSGVRKACQGRPVTEDDLALLAQRVEEAVRATGAAEIDAHEVGLADPRAAARARRGRLPAFRLGLPVLRLARGLRGRDHPAPRRARTGRRRAEPAASDRPGDRAHVEPDDGPPPHRCVQPSPDGPHDQIRRDTSGTVRPALDRPRTEDST